MHAWRRCRGNACMHVSCGCQRQCCLMHVWVVIVGCHALLDSEQAVLATVLGVCVFLYVCVCVCVQFTHVTRFLGHKVVLLGLYNGQKLQQAQEGDVVMYSRVLDSGSPAATFVRVLLLRGKMQGAVLIGETDLEETFENLILDGLDLSGYGPGLLDPDIELDHVFD